MQCGFLSDETTASRAQRTLTSVLSQWIAMEFMGGGSVASLVGTLHEPLSENEIARVCRDALTGLAFLHASGVMHRDVKGANVMLSRAADVKLIDFGVSATWCAAAMRAARGTTRPLTRRAAGRATSRTSGSRLLARRCTWRPK